MRKIDKKLNLTKVNLLAESRYLKSKSLNEEEYDFIKDFELTNGRKPTKDEIDTQYYGKTKPSGPKVQYHQKGPDGIYVGDTIENVKTGKRYKVTKEPYHKLKWDDDGEHTIGVTAIDFENESGEKYWGELQNYKKIHSDEELKTKADMQTKDNALIDVISQGLIDGGFFSPREIQSGEMFNSFTKGKLKHNEDIRNAISKIAADNNMDKYNKIVDKYWHNFW